MTRSSCHNRSSSRVNSYHQARRPPPRITGRRRLFRMNGSQRQCPSCLASSSPSPPFLSMDRSLPPLLIPINEAHEPLDLSTTSAQREEDATGPISPSETDSRKRRRSDTIPEGDEGDIGIPEEELECQGQIAQLDRDIRLAHRRILSIAASMEEELRRKRMEKDAEAEETRKRLEEADRTLRAELVRLKELKESVLRRVKDVTLRMKTAELELRTLQCATLKLRLRILENSPEEEDVPLNHGEELIRHSEAAFSALAEEKQTLLEVELELDHRIRSADGELSSVSHQLSSIRMRFREDVSGGNNERMMAALKAEQRHRVRRLLALNEALARTRFRRKEKEWMDWLSGLDRMDDVDPPPSSSSFLAC